MNTKYQEYKDKARLYDYIVSQLNANNCNVFNVRLPGNKLLVVNKVNGTYRITDS